jgi:hypothetical protein
VASARINNQKHPIGTTLFDKHPISNLSTMPLVQQMKTSQNETSGLE